MADWLVYRRGARVPLVVRDSGLRFGTAQEQTIIDWPDLVDIDYPSAVSAKFTLASGDVEQVGFATRGDQSAFASHCAEVMRASSNASHLAVAEKQLRPRVVDLLTIETVPGRRIVRVVGLVTSQVVMSRNVLSDMGSDLKNLVGGNLAGVERGIEGALQQARQRVSARAIELDADAVVGLRFEFASLAMGAQALVVTGTAVATQRTAEPVPAAPN